MSVSSFFKPNSKNSGHAIFFDFVSKDEALHVKFKKQTGWDAENKQGSFKNAPEFNIKLNPVEIGAILNCIERSIPSQLFHSTEKGNSSIQIKHFEKSDAEGGKVKDGFTISVSPRQAEGAEAIRYTFWFNNSEARLLKEYLQFVLNHFFSADYSQKKKEREEYVKKKAAAPVKKEVKEPEPDPVDNPFEETQEETTEPEDPNIW